MAGINKAIIIGNLGDNPAFNQTSAGKPVTNISVATSETWNDKESGEKKENTQWHRVAIFGKLAEIASQYLVKGSKVYIEGKIQTRKYTDDTGSDRYSTEIVVSGYTGKMLMLDKKQTSDNPAPDFSYEDMSQYKAIEKTDTDEDDIPF